MLGNMLSNYTKRSKANLCEKSFAQLPCSKVYLKGKNVLLSRLCAGRCAYEGFGQP
jgi:hypothetical protein